MQNQRSAITIKQFCDQIGISFQQFRFCCQRMGEPFIGAENSLVTERQIWAVSECHKVGQVKFDYVMFSKQGFFRAAVRGGHSKIIYDEKELRQRDESQTLGDPTNLPDPASKSPGKSGPEISVPMGGQPGFKKKKRRK
jgi:hypothetical protein